MATDTRKISFLPRDYLNYSWQCRIMNCNHIDSDTHILILDLFLYNDSRIVLNELKDLEVLDNDNDISLLHGLKHRNITLVSS